MEGIQTTFDIDPFCWRRCTTLQPLDPEVELPECHCHRTDNELLELTKSCSNVAARLVVEDGRRIDGEAEEEERRGEGGHDGTAFGNLTLIRRLRLRLRLVATSFAGPTF